MRKIIITLLISVIGGTLPAQNVTNDLKADSLSKLTKKEEKALIKAMKEAEHQLLYQSTTALIDTKKFVLEANFLSNQRGNRIMVNSSINFIRVDTTSAILQFGNTSGFGANGVGGVTAQGRISRWDLKKNDKKKSICLSITVITPIGTYDVFFDINASGEAYANVSSTTRGQLNFIGNIVPVKGSRAYKGTSL